MELCERFDLSAFPTFPLPGDEMVFVSSPRLGLASDTTDLGALFALPLFARREGCCSRMLLEKNLACVGHSFQEFRKVIVFDDLHVIMQAVLDGEGIAFLSRDVLGDHLTSGRLVPHHVPSFTHIRDRALVLGPHDSLAGPLLQFVRSLFGHFGQPMPEALEGLAAPALADSTAPHSGIVPGPSSRAQANRRTSKRRPQGSRSNQRTPVL
jgi:DNA-binding transcriptional LysR family regulator